MKYLKSISVEGVPGAVWSPPADIYKCGKQWLVKVELAGVSKTDIQLQVRGSRLIIRGVRRDRQVLQNQISQSMEIAYNRFERVFEFSRALEGAAIQTEYLDGMLLITIATGGQA